MFSNLVARGECVPVDMLEQNLQATASRIPEMAQSISPVRGSIR